MPVNPNGRKEFETFFEGHELEFQYRSSVSGGENVRDEWVYAASLEEGFNVAFDLKVVPESAEPDYSQDNYATVYISHEREPDRYLTELGGVPITGEWRDHFRTQIDKAFDRVQDLEHCGECDLPMLKYHDVAGPFYACASFECDNIVEPEPPDKPAGQESQ